MWVYVIIQMHIQAWSYFVCPLPAKASYHMNWLTVIYSQKKMAITDICKMLQKNLRMAYAGSVCMFFEPMDHIHDIGQVRILTKTILQKLQYNVFARDQNRCLQISLSFTLKAYAMSAACWCNLSSTDTLSRFLALPVSFVTFNFICNMSHLWQVSTLGSLKDKLKAWNSFHNFFSTHVLFWSLHIIHTWFED